MSDKIYNILKFIAQIFLPALATLIFALGSIWEFPAEQIAGTITAIDAFLGAVLGITSKVYYSQLPEDEGAGSAEIE